MRHRWDLQEYFWGIPLFYVMGAIVVGVTLPRLENHFAPALLSPVSADATIAILSSVASGMMALTGIVFSLAVVMVQFSATAYSPRLVLWMSRDPHLFHAIGIFAATFIYAIAALAWVDRGRSGRVPFLTTWFALLLVIASVFVLTRLVQRLAGLKVTSVLNFVGKTGRRVIAESFPVVLADNEIADVAPANGRSNLPPVVQVLRHQGPPKVIQSFDIASLARSAAQVGGVVEIVEAVGETAIEGTALLRIRGGNASLPEAALRRTVRLGAERTFEQDPKYAFRLLVDIAIKALSPAVNDPTTAVQALDHIEDLLCCLGKRRLNAGCVRDESGAMRVVFPAAAWQDYVSLALDEIRYYGRDSLQVIRRLRALLCDVIVELPPARRHALRAYLGRVDDAVPRAFRDFADRRDALVEDRQGLGMSRH